MHLTDLVLQGVRRFTESRKYPLKPGLNVVYGPTESGKSTLAACILDLLFPDRVKSGDEAPLVSWGTPQAARAGLTISSGREIYRVLKDFINGRISLSQYNPASQKFEPVAGEAHQIAALFNSTLGLPPFDIYFNLFVAAADHMPSALPLTIDDSKLDLTPPPSGRKATSSSGLAPELAPGGTRVQNPGAQGMPINPFLTGQGMTAAMGAPGMTPGAVMPGMMPGMVMPGHFQAMPDDGMTQEEREKRLTQLREELEQAEKIEELQYEIDGWQQKLFEIDSAKKGASQFDEFLDKAKEQLDRYPALKRLPEKIDEKLDRYKDLDSLQDDEISKLDSQLRKLDDELAEIGEKVPIHLDRLAQVGAGLIAAGIIAFIMGGQLADMGWLQSLFLLSLGGIGVLGWRVWNYLDLAHKRDGVEVKIKDLEEKREAIFKRYEVEKSVIEKLISDTDSDDLEEFRDKLNKYRDLKERYVSYQERKQQLVKELKLDQLKKQEKEIRDKIAALEDELRKLPALSQDINAIRLELKQIKTVIKKINPEHPLLKTEADTQAAPAEEGFGVPDLEPGPSSEDSGDKTAVGPAPPPRITSPGASAPGITSPGDSSATRGMKKRTMGPATATQAYDQLIELSARLFNIERTPLINHLQKRFNLYVNSFFNKRYSEARIDPDGSVALKSAETGKWVDFDKITPAARDTAYLALQITLLELATQKKSLPVILDNPTLRLDDFASAIAVKAVKRIAERNQIILFTAQKAALSQADHSFNLA